MYNHSMRINLYQDAIHEGIVFYFGRYSLENHIGDHFVKNWNFWGWLWGGLLNLMNILIKCNVQ